MSNIKVSLTKVRLNKSGYDSCGYYWGYGETLWNYEYYNENGFIESYWLRARDREEVKRKVRIHLPKATFFR